MVHVGPYRCCLNESLQAAPQPVSHFPATAKRVVHVVLMGGLSHIDSFDYKRTFAKFHGKPLQYKERPATFFNRIGLIRKNDWAFKQRGKAACGFDLFPHLATCADELAVVRRWLAPRPITRRRPLRNCPVFS